MTHDFRVFVFSYKPLGEGAHGQKTMAGGVIGGVRYKRGGSIDAGEWTNSLNGKFDPKEISTDGNVPYGDACSIVYEDNSLQADIDYGDVHGSDFQHENYCPLGE